MSWLSLYKILFMTELLAAEVLLTYHYPKRKGFAYLCPLALILCYGAVIFFPEYLVDGWVTSSLMFLWFFVVSIVGLLICFRVKFVNLLFCATSAYTVQHLFYVIFSFINVTFFNSQAFTTMAYENSAFSFDSFSGVMAFSVVVYLIVFIIVYLYCFLVLKKYVGKDGDLKFKSIALIIFVLFVLIVDVVISDVFRDKMEDASDLMEIFYCLLSILLCLCLLYIQMSMIKTKDIENEMIFLSRLYDEQQKHYQIRKETIDLINVKCHDFRHQIRIIGSNYGVNNQAMEEMQSIISLYDADIRTGSKTLDIILTEKSLLCREKGIEFTCIVNGKLLDFIAESDLYALFGNILDNAIEAVDVLQSKTKRCVNFIVGEQQGTIFIREKNYYMGEITSDENGLPITKKGDTQYHGFGMKSIQAIAEKYGGIMQVKTLNNIFQLSIVFFENNDNQ